MTTTRLQHELKKRRPFDSVEQEAALNIVRTNDQLQIRFSRLFREFELTPSQYNVLRILRGEGQPLPILEIANRTITVVPGITGLIDRLEEAGLVARQRCEEDRRVVYVSLTAKATKLLAKIDQPLLDMHKRLLAGLSVGELTQLNALLEKIRTSFADAPE
ncbi:MAG TPA: MarR family transcriptional regulator [Pirellulales bacterium]|jgi:DNA-binding MarR family transcriptional regulator